MDQIRVATWNVGWTSSGSRHFEQSRDRITELDADILVLTETTRSLVPTGGYLARGGPDWGYESKSDRRKVMLWSRSPITDVSSEISEPGGRHICATVESPVGPVRVHAVCAPWAHAHVSGGRRDRTVWQDHLSYLLALKYLLRREADESGTKGLPLIVAGDINQREQPRPYGSHKVRKVWAEVLGTVGLTLATDETMIDKVVISPELTASDPLIFPPDRMSDHHAVSCLVRLSG